MDIVSSENFKLRYSEIDCTHTLKPQILLNFMQDLASDNAQKLGFGYSFVRENNLAWFLLKYHIEFYDYPEKIYNIEILTNPRGYNKLFAYRDFEIKYDSSIIARAASIWGLVDINTKSMVLIAPKLKNCVNFSQYQKSDSDLVFEKIKPIDRVDFEKEFEAMYDDLDVNQHVNNSNYIKWALEVLDFDFIKTHKLKTIDMVFKKELKYSEHIISRAQKENSTTLHTLINKDTKEELCSISAKWEEKK
ncbi:hypothetical protein IJ531_00420 [bacterium]|nr:hypothetical protein [bacterium]